MSQYFSFMGHIVRRDARRQWPGIFPPPNGLQRGYGGPRVRFRPERLEPRLMLSGDPPMVADFGLTDVNPDSATFEQVVSPRDYLQQVSGWYFGHAT